MRRAPFPGSSVLASFVAIAAGLAAMMVPCRVAAQCTEQGPLQNYTGGGQVVCPCFAAGEEAGAIFTVPAGEYPIEILKIGIGWGSQFGGTGQQLEEAIHIYAGGLPNPGTPIFSLPGPQLTDGAINEFDISLTPGNKTIASGPFTVTLEFLNGNAGDIFAPSVVHDGNGCQPGKNVVKAIPGGWTDACALLVTGDWVFYVKYRSLKAIAAASPSQVFLTDVPGNQTTCDTLTFRNDGCDTLQIASIDGCTAPPFSIDTTMTDDSIPPGDSTEIVVCVTPTTADPDTCTISISSSAVNGTVQVDVVLGVVTGADAPRVADVIGYVSVVPNPFNPSTTVRFSLREAAPVRAEVYTVGGRRIRTLARGQRFSPGENTLRWDGRNDGGGPVASGVYLVRISTPLGSRVARAVLLK